MTQPNANPTPPGDAAWDITVTRLARALRPRVEACARDLAGRFQAIGLACQMQVRQTPRGLSTFLALVGQRGLICIVDMTLVDGMAIGRGPGASLEFRLLDACGDLVADDLAGDASGLVCGKSPGINPADLDRAATAIYEATLAQFELSRYVPPVRLNDSVTRS